MKWASRWDTYLTMSDVQIHWFSIVNSVVVVFFLSGTSERRRAGHLTSTSGSEVKLDTASRPLVLPVCG